MLPVVKGVKNTKKQIFAYTWILLILIGISVYYVHPLSFIFGIVGGVGTIIFSLMSWELMISEGISKAKKVYLFSLLYLAILFIVIMIDGLI
jgi:protoheme IX farnesyltransferase